MKLLEYSHRLDRRLLRTLVATLFLIGALSALAQSPPTISKAFSAATVPKNQSVTLTFTITNPNPATDLTGVAFNDNLPAGLIIANPDSLVVDPVLGNCDPTGTTGVITPAGTSISLSGGQLPATATCTFSIDVLALTPGIEINTSGAVTSNEGGTGGTATATVTVQPSDLTITKTHTGNFRQGQAGATYTITVSNSGAADTDAPVTVTDALPAGLTATAITGSGWSCSAPPTLTCTQPGGLTAGTSFPAITVTVNVAANAPPTIINTAVVSGGGEIDTSNDTATDPTNVDQVADLTITKTHSGNFTPGQTGATYTITIQNVGPGPTLGTVTVTDTLPNIPNTLVPTNMAGTGWSCTLSTLTCTRGDVLPAGASYPPITLTVNVPSNIQVNFVNSATVSGGGELNTANDTANDSSHTGANVQLTAQIVNMMVTTGGITSTVLNVDSNISVGTLTFSCSGLPAGATCSFNPPSTAALTTQVTMSITTTPRSFALILPVGSGKPPFNILAIPVVALAAGIVVFVVGRSRRQLALALVGMALLAMVVGCGSSTSKGTPAGTSTITVTATGQGGSGSTTVNLTVL